MRNRERCRWCFDIPRLRAQPILTTPCSCHMSQMSHVMSHVVSHKTCPLSSAHVTCVIIQLPSCCGTLWWVCLIRASYIQSHLCPCCLYLHHMFVSLLLRQISGVFLVSVNVKCVRGTCQHICISHRGS